MIHQAGLNVAFVQGLVHAPDPLITFDGSNRKRHMPHSQTWMPKLLHIQLRAAGPARKKHKKLLARLTQTIGVQRAKLGGFGCRIDNIVKTLHESPQNGLPSDQFVKS